MGRFSTGISSPRNGNDSNSNSNTRSSSNSSGGGLQRRRNYAALPGESEDEMSDDESHFPRAETQSNLSFVSQLDEEENERLNLQVKSDYIEEKEEVHERVQEEKQSPRKSSPRHSHQQQHLNEIDLNDNEIEKGEKGFITQQQEEDQEEKKDKVIVEEEEEEEEEEIDPGTIHIRILDLNGKIFNIVCCLDWNVRMLKKKVHEVTEVTEEAQRLIYRGRVLEDESILSTYKVEDGHTIHLFVRRTQNEEVDLNETSSNGRENGNENRMMDDYPITIAHLNNDTVSSAVFPSDSAHRVDPLMLDSPLGTAARRVKLWSSFLLIIYTMKVMGQFALLANDQEARHSAMRHSETVESDEFGYKNRYDYPRFYNQDPMIGILELLVHAFGVYVGCVGFKAAHDTDIRPVRVYCRGIVWLALLTTAEQIMITVQIAHSDYPKKRMQNPYGAQLPSLDDIISANIFQTVMLVVMWVVATNHALVHRMEVQRYSESFAQAAINAMPAQNLPQDPV